MKEEFILPAAVLDAVRGQALFYPCSGNDTACCFKLFSSHISDFWFVDIGYFHSMDSHRRSLLDGHSGFRLLDKSLVGPAVANVETRYDEKTGKSYLYLEPCVVTETYEYIKYGVIMKVHRRRGFGVSGFRKHISRLGVFFYRGDSPGEGGSGNRWLHSDRINEVCNKLVDGGLIVTDGSQHGGRDERFYKELWKYNWKDVSFEPSALIDDFHSFEDRFGRQFTCVGYAGKRYGPTMIWQVRNSAHQDAPADRLPGDRLD